MATQAHVRRIALSLPETVEAQGRFAFSVRHKDKLMGFVWVWMERVTPKKPRVPNRGSLLFWLQMPGYAVTLAIVFARMNDLWKAASVLMLVVIHVVAVAAALQIAA